MGPTDQPPVVCDAGSIIHLDELSCLDLLSDFGAVLVPSQVWSEAVHHRSGLRRESIPRMSLVDAVGGPSPQLLVLADSLSLDRGERAALTLLQARGARLLLCDDSAARLAAESLGVGVHGTIGILLRSIRRATRTRQQVLSLLRDLPNKSSLHVSSKLLTTVIETVRQDRTSG